MGQKMGKITGKKKAKKWVKNGSKVQTWAEKWVKNGGEHAKTIGRVKVGETPPLTLVHIRARGEVDG